MSLSSHSHSFHASRPPRITPRCPNGGDHRGTPSSARGVPTREVVTVPDVSPGAEQDVSTLQHGAESAMQFNDVAKGGLRIMEQYKQAMASYVKNQLFRKLKFITNDRFLSYSTKEESLCYYICQQCNVPPASRETYWPKLKAMFKSMIKDQRTNATTSLKKVFMGKLLASVRLQLATNYGIFKHIFSLLPRLAQEPQCKRQGGFLPIQAS